LNQGILFKYVPDKEKEVIYLKKYEKYKELGEILSH